MQHYAAGATSGADSWCLGSLTKVKRQRGEHDGLPPQGQHNVPPLVYLVPTGPVALIPSRPQWVNKARPQLA